MEALKNAAISKAIIELRKAGMELPEAWNAVLGSVCTYDQLVSELYDALREKGGK